MANTPRLTAFMKMMTPEGLHPVTGMPDFDRFVRYLAKGAARNGRKNTTSDAAFVHRVVKAFRKRPEEMWARAERYLHDEERWKKHGVDPETLSLLVLASEGREQDVNKRIDELKRGDGGWTLERMNGSGGAFLLMLTDAIGDQLRAAD